MREAVKLRSRVEAMLPTDALVTRIVHGAFWSLIATAFSQGLTFASYGIAARVLPRSEFGELGIIQSTVGVLGAFAGMGLGMTATKYVAEFRRTDPGKAGRIIGLTMILAVVLSGAGGLTLGVFSPFLAEYTLNAPHLADDLRIGCLLLLLNTLDGVQCSVLAGLEAFSSLAIANFFRGIASISLISWGVYCWGLPGALCGLTASAAVGVMVNRMAIVRQCRRCGIPISYRGIHREFPIIVNYAIPSFASAAVAALAAWGARTMLVNRPGGYLEVAEFTVASRFQDVFNLAGQTIGAALLPMLASGAGTGSERLNRTNIVLSWIMGTAIILPLMCFPEVVGTVFGAHYATRDSMRTFVVVLLSTSLVMYKQGLSRVLAARNLMWWGAASNALWGAVVAVCAWQFLGAGARGLAAAVLAGYVVSTVAFMPLYIRRELVDRRLVASPGAAVVWAVTVAAAASSYFGGPVWLRIGVSGLGMGVIALAFRRLLSRGAPEGRAGEPICAEEGKVGLALP